LNFFFNYYLIELKMPKGQGNAGGWPSTTGNPSGGGRSNAPSSSNSNTSNGSSKK
jgi:hypothetical protein